MSYKGVLYPFYATLRRNKVFNDKNNHFQTGLPNTSQTQAMGWASVASPKSLIFNKHYSSANTRYRWHFLSMCVFVRWRSWGAEIVWCSHWRESLVCRRVRLSVSCYRERNQNDIMGVQRERWHLPLGRTQTLLLTRSGTHLTKSLSKHWALQICHRHFLAC